MDPWLREYLDERKRSQGPPWTPCVHSVWSPETGRIRVYDEDGYTLLAEGHGDQEEARRLVGEAKRKKEQDVPKSKYKRKRRKPR